MNDEEIRKRINALSREEEDLYRDAADGQLAPAELSRLTAIKLELDQSWDLLHQREALRSAGMDPERARARSIDTVEHYQQ
jgi:hypothetical protein